MSNSSSILTGSGGGSTFTVTGGVTGRRIGVSLGKGPEMCFNVHVILNFSVLYPIKGCNSGRKSPIMTLIKYAPHRSGYKKKHPFSLIKIWVKAERG